MWYWSKKHTAENKPAAGPGAREVPAGGRTALTREVAGVASDMYEPLLGYLGARPNRDPLLSSQTPDRAYAYPYGLFEEALDKDAHLSALIAQRKAAVLSWERHVVPADDSPQARAVARFVEAALEGIGGSSKQYAVDSMQKESGGFEHDLSELLDAIPYGFAVSEVVWEEVDSKQYAVGSKELAASGSAALQADESEAAAQSAGSLLSTAYCLLPTCLLSRHPRRFVFGAGGELRLLTPAEPLSGEALPERKFVVFSPYGRHENPYGLPALRSVWWLCWFKRQALKFWVMFAEKFGSPTAVLKHPLSATEREKRAYRRIIGTIQQETGLVVPEGVELSLLEAQRGGTVGTYKELCEFCNSEMSKAILGQTLTSDVGERGSLALGSVHYAVREDIVRQDARALESVVNGQLIRWIVDLNFPPALRLYPRWELHPPSAQDLGLQLEIDRFFAERGLPTDETELFARYARKKDSGVRIQDPGETANVTTQAPIPAES